VAGAARGLSDGREGVVAKVAAEAAPVAEGAAAQAPVRAERDRPLPAEAGTESAREAVRVSGDGADQQRAAVSADEVDPIGELRPRERPGLEDQIHEACELSRGDVERTPAGGAGEERLVPGRQVLFDVLQVVEELQEDAVAEGEALVGLARRLRHQMQIREHRAAALLEADREQLRIAEPSPRLLLEAA
jgi:hypothetical protein